MPTLPVPPDGIARVEYFGVNDDAEFMNGFWLQLTGAFGSGEREDLATDLYGVYQDDFLPAMSNTVTLQQCKLTSYEAGGEFIATSSASHAGGTADQTFPANVCVLISWGIPEHYRGGHPRTYLPGGAQLASGSRKLIDSGVQATFTAEAAAFMGDINALTTPGITEVNLGTLARVRAGAALTPAEFEGFTSAFCRQRVASQRRRLKG